jgi:hypothetical protein
VRDVRPILLFCAALGAPGACTHHLRYRLDPRETPRAGFGTPYVLAVSEFGDRRVKEDGSTRSFPDGEYRFLPDLEVPVAAEVPEALERHLRHHGLFRRVVREHPDARAHLLLSGEVHKLRVYAQALALSRREIGSSSGGLGGSAPAAHLEVPVRAEVALRLILWRVDRKLPVWNRFLPLSFTKSYRGGLAEVTNLAFRDAMNVVVAEIGKALAPYRAGPPHLEGAP